MATGAGNETKLWGERQIFLRDAKGLEQDFQNIEFFSVTIPLLAEHFQRRALSKLQRQDPWLTTFITSEPDFVEARKEFLVNGSNCTTILEQFAKLIRIAEGNDHLIFYETTEPTYTPFISRLDDVRREHESRAIRSTGDDDDVEEISGLKEAMKKMVGRGDQHPFYQEAGAALLRHKHQTVTPNFSRRAWHDMCITAAEPLLDRDNERLDRLELARRLPNFLFEIMKQFDIGLALSSPWYLLKANFRDFAHYIGCPKAHDAPEDNVAAMRLFNSTQMPFFQKLQNDLEDQKRINNKQQEIITALVFRHLTESLPPQQYKGHKDSTKRWQAFWTDAIIKENQDQALNTHPLTHVHNYFSGTKRVVGANGQITDKSQEGMKGNLYRAGEELFGTLSTNIHKYGKGGSKDVYVVADDHWGETVRELLRALVPVHFKDGEVDWDMERTRFI